MQDFHIRDLNVYAYGFSAADARSLHLLRKHPIGACTQIVRLASQTRPQHGKLQHRRRDTKTHTSPATIDFFVEIAIPICDDANLSQI